MIPAGALAIILALPAADTDGPVEFRASAEPATVTVAESVTLTLTARTPTGWVLSDITPPLTVNSLVGGLAVVSSDRSAPAMSPDGAITTTFTFSLAPGLPGAATIPSISISARGPGGIEEASASTEPIAITVRSVLDGADAAAFTPSAIRPPIVPPSHDPMHPLVWIAIGVGLGIAMLSTAFAVSRLGRRVKGSTLDTLERDLAGLTADQPDPARLAMRASAIVRGALAHSVDPRFLTAAAGPEVAAVLATTPMLTPDERLAISTVLTDAERIACGPNPPAASGARLVDGARTALNIARDAARRRAKEAAR